MAKVIKISQKQGFHCESDGCCIYDVRGPFLQYSKSVNFNLPAGTYTVTQGTVSALLQPVQYPMPALPVAEKNADLDVSQIKEIPARTVMEGGVSKPNPKFCIDIANAEYYYNPDWIKTLTTPQLVFCQNHEIGHFFYYSQEKCDQWAEYNMLEMGFNPQQITLASHDTLCGTCPEGGIESFLGIKVPLESATRRMNTEDRMYDISQMAAMANNTIPIIPAQ